MTELEKIYERLDLFPEYIKYRLDAKFTQIGFTYTPKYIMDALKKHGFMIELRDIGVPLLSFEQWLVLYNRQELATDAETITIGINPMMQVAKYGGQSVQYDILGSFDLFRNIDEMLNNHYNRA